MHRYFTPEEWAVTEDHYQPALNRLMETIFFTGNGYLGLRGVPEEGAPAELSTPVNFVAPIYDLVKSYPDYHVRNVTHCSVNVACANWYGTDILINGIRFDPHAGKVREYRRTLDLNTATVTRQLIWEDAHGEQTALRFTRFVSMDDRHLAALTVEVCPLNWSGPVELATSIDASGVKDQMITDYGMLDDGGVLCTRTQVTGFDTATAMRALVSGPLTHQFVETTDDTVTLHVTAQCEEGHTLRLEKFVAVCTSRDVETAPAKVRAQAKVDESMTLGYAELHRRHCAKVAEIWQEGDVVIDGDPAAQQGIRFCILNMHQNYAGTDARVNMAAKGLSGPGYGGLYWWDTEMYMMPFFLYTAPEKARQLVLYRYLTLDGARNKARHYGYQGAMFPWVTIDGEERSGDWEYGMLEQHVTSAVAHAVRHYVEVSGDEEFLWQYGVELLVETSRFWASRVTYSTRKGQYVINHVTGPDEYAVGVNNNCYTNVMAQANLAYGVEVVRRMQAEHPAQWAALAEKLGFAAEEPAHWAEVAEKMFIPYDGHLGILEQDDSFLDRDPIVWRDVPQQDKPTGKWNWDRLMRSQALKQADVVLLQFIKHDMFDDESKRRNYLFYEPKTTHESSLSPCIHAIMAAEIGLEEDAFNYYLHAARLDLDDVNGNADQGLHIANTAGSWLCIVSGFAGMRQSCGQLSFTPHLPTQWHRLTFAMTFRGRRLQVELLPDAMHVTLHTGDALSIIVAGSPVLLQPGETHTIPSTAVAGV